MPGQLKLRMRDRMRARTGEARMAMLGVFRCLSRVPGLKRPYHMLLVRLIKRTGLFERTHYLELNADVANDGMTPLRHYVMYGDREGRWPMAFFDPAYYRSHASGRTKHVNALLHYAYVGRHRRISPSPWFDVDFYLGQNKDVARANIDPLLHFVKWGGLEGRSPTASFDGAYYLQTNPEVRETRINPLAHYLLRGRLEGRRTCPDPHEDELTTSTGIHDTVPDEASWFTLRPRSGGEEAKVDVIVPVYKGYTETLRCIYSALSAASQTSFELIVIDDDSPDVALKDALRHFASRGLFTLLANPENQGFVATVNYGMTLHPNRDVVLLNSDAEVFDGWLDRLTEIAAIPDVGTITPLSNNATICSYPQFLHDNPFPLELSYAELDAMAAQVNAGILVDAPTGVGFCMFIKRDCLNAVGIFDQKTFGKGYGEENDFCQRAIGLGWRNVIAANTFVRHWGAASFLGEKGKRVQVAMKLMARRHPRYLRDVDEFIKRDPLAAARHRLDGGRLQRMCRKKNVLIVCHNRGGGTERHVQEDVQRLEAEGYGVFLLRPVRGNPTHGIVRHPRVKSLLNLTPLDLADVASLTEALRYLRITEVHTHGLVDFAPESAGWLAKGIKAIGARWEVNLHDYKVICPRVNLADENGLYCGEPGIGECNACLATRGSDFKIVDIRKWRAMHESALRCADEILVPDEDVAIRLKRYFPNLNFSVSPHEDVEQWPLPRTRPANGSNRLRIVVIGAIGKLKGFDVLLGCARDATKRKLPLDLALLGFSMNDNLLREAGVHVTGKYHDRDVLRLLQELAPDLVFLPSLWPETYSYTLSIGLSAGHLIAAFDIGAIARRLRTLNRNDILIPISKASKFDEINDTLLDQVVRSQTEYSSDGFMKTSRVLT